LHGVSCIFQISNTIVEFHSDDSRHILAKEPIGPDIGNNPHKFRPEVTVIVTASFEPGVTEWLAGESPADESWPGDTGLIKRSS